MPGHNRKSRKPFRRHTKAAGSAITTASVVASPYFGHGWIVLVCVIVLIVVIIEEETE